MPIPSVVAFRLAEYHCLLAEMLKSGDVRQITSRIIAARLGLSEETVRKDLSYIPHDIGKPGLGYDPVKLYRAIARLLHVDTRHEVILVGSIATWNGVFNFFDPRKYGFLPTAVFSEDPADDGLYFDGAPVYQIEQIPRVLENKSISFALIACDSSWAKRAAELAASCGVKGILNLSPAILDELPAEVYVSQIFLPCELKLVTYHALEGNQPRNAKEVKKKAQLKRKK